MRKFVPIDSLIDCGSHCWFPNGGVQSVRRALLAPPPYTPHIQQALQTSNFRFHRTCSFSTLIRECNAGEGRTLLMFWAREGCESKATMSVSASSCSSLLLQTSVTSPASPASPALRTLEVRSCAQQTDISCRYFPGLSSPVSMLEGAECGPAASALPVAGAARSLSLLGSVCALLLTKQPGCPPVAGKTSSVTSRGSEQVCRICFGGASAERLVRPCGCRGTIAAVHRSCLERWLLQAATSYCELCRHHYVVTRTHKWSWVRSVVEWGRSGRARALAGDAWRALALGACSVLGTARALHACDHVLQAGARRGGSAALFANLFSSLLIGIIGALNGLLTTWMLLKIQEHQLSWQSWRDSTLHVHVTLEEESLELQRSDVTVVAERAGRATADRSTNVADPFMVAMPYALLQLPDTSS